MSGAAQMSDHAMRAILAPKNARRESALDCVGFDNERPVDGTWYIAWQCSFLQCKDVWAATILCRHVSIPSSWLQACVSSAHGRTSEAVHVFSATMFYANVSLMLFQLTYNTLP